MRFKALLAAAAIMAVSAGPAAAQAITGEDPEAIAKVLRDKGLAPTVLKGNSGEPLIRGTADGLGFLVIFNCQGATNCTSVTFMASVDMEKPYPIEKTNLWNTERLSARIYLRNDDPVLTMDVGLWAGGIPKKLFEDNVAVWQTQLKTFRQHLAQ